MHSSTAVGFGVSRGGSKAESGVSVVKHPLLIMSYNSAVKNSEQVNTVLMYYCRDLILSCRTTPDHHLVLVL